MRDGRRLILVVNGLGSMAERAQETSRLMEWGFREFTNTTVFRAGDTVVEAPVWLGAQDKVPLVVPRAVQITAPTGQARDAARGRALRRAARRRRSPRAPSSAPPR